jgi:hypothetical protein
MLDYTGHPTDDYSTCAVEGKHNAITLEREREKLQGFEDVKQVTNLPLETARIYL